MIIKNKIDNEPVLSNVGEVGEFRIRNSAKAFNILSSGLYANKIRAIIREYSCNAVDSHVEAGRTDTPFDVHLPNTLEPWFAVRDYGVGLDEQQVRNIFTTYFESTKTAIDELIGGLGLGSKSAFSFTDNFTIVAVKGGIKRVFTAFINDQGVPSIAPMGEEQSNEPNGVEIRFSVEDPYDFRKFYNEAQHVYKHFKLRPVVSGVSNFQFTDPDYTDRDIIPGVHANERGYGSSYAIMGNIEYPLDIPSNMDLGEVGHLLRCGLTIEFAIGELDIQASREGLSYIPETVSAIKAKLEALNSVLADRVAEEVAGVKNAWEKAYLLEKKLNSDLWSAATRKFVTDTNFDLITNSRYNATKKFLFDEKTLEQKYNIVIRGFSINYNGYSNPAATRINLENVYNNDTSSYEKHVAIRVAKETMFVVNDTTVGASERAKYHWKNTKDVDRNDHVYVIEKADKKKDMNTKAFFKALSNPPKSQIRKASTLMIKERAAGIGKDVSILKLERRNMMGHMNSQDMVWRDAGKIDQFDDSKTYYYLPLVGFRCEGVARAYDMKTFARALADSGILDDTVYGVRKADLEKIKGKTNWVDLDTYVADKLAQPNIIDVKGVVKEAIRFGDFFRHPGVHNHVEANSPYLAMYNEFADVVAGSANARKALQTLCTIYKVDAGNINVSDEVAKYKTTMENLSKRYPLLEDLSRYYRNAEAIAEYINAMDALKGI
jgi:hypothetical protein